MTDGGFTLEFANGRSLQQGYAVCADPTANFVCHLDEWTSPDVAAWVGRAREHLATGTVHLGGWLEGDGSVCLDLVRVMPPEQRHEAVVLGAAAGQRAIFDLERREVVHLSRLEVAR